MGKSLGATSEKARNYIPDDLTFSILSKLPLKSLKRLGCVQKSWALLFENSQFMDIFFKNFITNNNSYDDDTSILLYQGSSNFNFLSGERFENQVNFVWPNQFQEENPCFKFFYSGSITGIICFYYEPHNAVLWNPATGESKIIPPSPIEPLPFYDTFFVGICGFGYDHVRNDYKLLRYIPYPTGLASVSFRPHDFLWEIYSLRSNSWRQLAIDYNLPYSPMLNGSCKHIYLAGMCHWLGLGKSTTPLVYLLYSFDLSNEVFSTTHITSSDDDLVLYLAVLNESIALISSDFHAATSHISISISILGELSVKESWTKLFTVGNLSFPLCNYRPYRPLGIGKNGDIFFGFDSVVRVNLNTHSIDEFDIELEGSSCILFYKKNFFRFEE